MATVPLTTFADVVEYLVQYVGDNGTQDALRDCRRAAIDGLRELASAHEWSYYWTRGRVVTDAPQTSSTITYDHTGGAYERMVTIAAGTWPTWAKYGQLVISNIAYQVDDYKSSTVITLASSSNPGADVAAGTSYTLYRDSYPLPTDVLQLDQMINVSNSIPLQYVHPSAWLTRQQVYYGPSGPSEYTLTGSEDVTGRMAVRFYPVPDDDYTIDFMYRRRPRALVYHEVDDGTVSVTGGTTTVTGSGTAFTAGMVGSVIRLSANSTDAPTNAAGANVYAVERIITAYTSATSVTVDDTIDDTYSGVKYQVSDRVDVEEGAMLTAYLRSCERQAAIVRVMKNDRQAREEYLGALIQAREADRRNSAFRGPGYGPNVARLRDYPAGSDAGT